MFAASVRLNPARLVAVNMQKKEITLVAFLLILGVLYVVFFTDWFRKKTLTIVPSARPERGIAAGTPLPVYFKLNRSCELTSLKVIPLQGTNFDAHTPPIWYLVANTNSRPTKLFQYGVPIRGMHPAIPKAQPEPLEPGHVYRMIVSTTDLTGYTDFKTMAMPGR
jgi:hypothetical protein